VENEPVQIFSVHL